MWATFIVNMEYLQGALVLDYALRKAGSKYPLIALYTDSFPVEAHKVLDDRGILKQHIPFLCPSTQKEFTVDVRLNDCWSKLAVFSLTEYERIVLLDSDMLILKNMDELMDFPLDPPELEGKGNRLFAASHACVCNPQKKPHYRKDWYVGRTQVIFYYTDDLTHSTGSRVIVLLPLNMPHLMSRRRPAPRLRVIYRS